MLNENATMFHVDDNTDLEEEEFLQAALCIEQEAAASQPPPGKRRSFELGEIQDIAENNDCRVLKDAQETNQFMASTTFGGNNFCFKTKQSSHAECLLPSPGGSSNYSPVIPVISPVKQTIIPATKCVVNANPAAIPFSSVENQPSGREASNNSQILGIAKSLSTNSRLQVSLVGNVSRDTAKLTSQDHIDCRLTSAAKNTNGLLTSCHSSNQIYTKPDHVQCSSLQTTSNNFQAVCSKQRADTNLFKVSQDSFDSDLDLSLECLKEWDDGVEQGICNKKSSSDAHIVISPKQSENRINDSDWNSLTSSPVVSGNIEARLSNPMAKPSRLPKMDLSPIPIKKPSFVSKLSGNNTSDSQGHVMFTNRFATHIEKDTDTCTFVKPTLPVNHRPRTPAVPAARPNRPTDTDLGGPLLSETDSPASSRTSRLSNRLKRKRKFPGPAGVLPKLTAGVSLDSLSHMKPPTGVPPTSPQANKPVTEPDLPSSQCWDDHFIDWPWQQMKKELEPQAERILADFSVEAVLRKASKKMLPKGKVPVICVLIERLELHSADASVLLRDTTGEMKGTIHRQLLKEYQEQLLVGSVLVLRQVGVFSPSSRSHYLNITPNNLLRIYCKNQEGVASTERLTEFSPEDFVVSLIANSSLNISPAPQQQTPVQKPPQQPLQLFQEIQRFPLNSSIRQGNLTAMSSNTSGYAPILRQLSRTPTDTYSPRFRGNAQVQHTKNVSHRQPQPRGIHPNVPVNKLAIMPGVCPCKPNATAYAQSIPLRARGPNIQMGSQAANNSLRPLQPVVPKAVSALPEPTQQTSRFSFRSAASVSARPTDSKSALQPHASVTVNEALSAWSDDDGLDEVLTGLDENLLKDF